MQVYRTLWRNGAHSCQGFFDVRSVPFRENILFTSDFMIAVIAGILM